MRIGGTALSQAGRFVVMIVNRHHRGVLAIFIIVWLNSQFGCALLPESRFSPLRVNQPKENDLPLSGFTQVMNRLNGKDDGTTKEEKQVSIQLAIARSAEGKGDTTKAIAMYTRVIERDAKSALAHYRLAVLRDKQGDPRTAKELYHRAIELSPQDADIHCDLGYSYYLVGEFAEAEKSLRRAITLRSNFARAHNNLALLLARHGRIDEALLEFSKSGVPEREARSNIALALMLEGDGLAAHEQLELAGWVSGESESPKLSQLRRVLARAGQDTPHNAEPNLVRISSFESETPDFSRSTVESADAGSTTTNSPVRFAH